MTQNCDTCLNIDTDIVHTFSQHRQLREAALLSASSSPSKPSRADEQSTESRRAFLSLQHLDMRGRPGLLRTVLEAQETRGLTRADDISRLLPSEVNVVDTSLQR